MLGQIILEDFLTDASYAIVNTLFMYKIVLQMNTMTDGNDSSFYFKSPARFRINITSNENGFCVEFTLRRRARLLVWI